MENVKPSSISEPQELEVKITDWLDKEGLELRTRQQKELRATYPSEPGQPPSGDDIPIFLILKRAGIPIGCGALRPLEDEGFPQSAEIKRMYVDPEFRGKSTGIADVLMKQLEEQCAIRGWTTVKLETDRLMLGARKFYERQGYKEIALFGHYIHATGSICYEKTLSPKPKAAKATT